jgi:hypothetical protein
MAGCRFAARRFQVERLLMLLLRRLPQLPLPERLSASLEHNLAGNGLRMCSRSNFSL